MRDPLRVMEVPNEPPIVLDGHHRLELALEYGFPYRIESVRVSTPEEAEAWILRFQRARRNLSEQALQYTRGRAYLLEITQGQRSDLSTSRQDGEKLPAEHLASEFGVSERTIERDGALARVVDGIAETHGLAFRQRFLAGDVRMNREQARLVGTLPEERRTEFVDHVLKGVSTDEALGYAMQPRWSEAEEELAEQAMLEERAMVEAVATKIREVVQSDLLMLFKQWSAETAPHPHPAVNKALGATKKIGQALALLLAVRPHRLCYECLGRRKDCTGCGGVGWLPEGGGW
ncbi:MAG: hypothetical protein KC731_23305 [Myxococcales bacterium]|nr:hypothetical protein [Myxococcales bacterium]